MHATITDWETEMPATPESFAEAVGDYFVNLAYWFFYLRVIHSIYHIFFMNQQLTVATLCVLSFGYQQLLLWVDVGKIYYFDLNMTLIHAYHPDIAVTNCARQALGWGLNVK